MPMALSKLARSEISRLLNNYGLSLMGGGSYTAPGFNLFASNDVRHGSSIPILYGEAEETRQALERLPRPQYRVLMLQHVTRPPVRARLDEMKLPLKTYYRLAAVAEESFLARASANKKSEGLTR
jgi:hypothetical protein